jgi:hypothetical protein
MEQLEKEFYEIFNIQGYKKPIKCDIYNTEDIIGKGCRHAPCINCNHAEIIDCYDHFKITDTRLLLLMALLNRITNHNYLTNLVIEGECIDEIKEEVLKEYIERKDIIPIQLVQEIFNV